MRVSFFPVLVLLGLLFARGAVADEKSVRVFVALCDNKNQGIVPVGAKIGDGDKPDANLYWGCSDGFGSYFKRSRKWKVLETKADVSRQVMRRLKLRHADGDVVLTADAYRGSEIRRCLEEFEKAVAGGEHDLVAFIGHNGLMDFSLAEKPRKDGAHSDAVVLCCRSEGYFGARLKNLGSRPVLMTRQLMYPGAFLLHDAIEVWKAGGSRAAIRNAAGRAYAKNQKISVKAATGVFARLEGD